VNRHFAAVELITGAPPSGGQGVSHDVC
jgi:hypothetical protein